MFSLGPFSRCMLRKFSRNAIIGTLCVTLIYYQYSHILLLRFSVALPPSLSSQPPSSQLSPRSRHPPPFLDNNININNINIKNININNMTELLKSYLTAACSIPRPTATGREKRMGVWEAVGRGDKEWIFVYSAFFDDRPAAGILPNIRIVTMATIFRHKVYEDVYCYVWYDGIVHPIVVKAIVNETGANLYEHKGLLHGEFTITCPLHFHAFIPSHVSLSLDYCPASLASFTPVRYAPRAPPGIQFGICVVNGYGSFKAEEMIEWFEAYISFGVREFNLYNTSYARHLRPVFSYYEQITSELKNRGVLSVRQLPHPTSGSGSQTETVRNLRTVAMNDCLMRNMYRYKYILTVDHDEIVIPRKSKNYQGMLKQIFKEDVADNDLDFMFTAQNLYFLKDFDEDKDAVKTGGGDKKAERKRKISATNKDWKLLTERYRYRAAVETGSYFFATKSFVNPLYCFNLFNHYCSAGLPPHERIASYHVPVEIVASHHYRKCEKFYATNCSTLLNQKTLDESALRLTEDLRRNVANVYNKIW